VGERSIAAENLLQDKKIMLFGYFIRLHGLCLRRGRHWVGNQQ
jgi:hypothetical protein